MFERYDEADLDDAEYPDGPDDEDDGDDEMVPCPRCGQPIHEEAERCLYCGCYHVREEAPRRYSWWFILGFLLSLVVVSGWVVRW